MKYLSLCFKAVETKCTSQPFLFIVLFVKISGGLVITQLKNSGQLISMNK